MGPLIDSFPVHRPSFIEAAVTIGRRIEAAGPHSSMTQHHHSACDHSAHACDHDHGHLDLASAAPGKQRQLVMALVLIGSFAIAELTIGQWSHSLALVAESGHLAADCFALGLALVATWLAQLPKAIDRRMETWAALINGLGLGVIAVLVGGEALQHLQQPPAEIASLPMLVTACVGFGVNAFNVKLLHSGSDHDLNLKAAFLHVLADMVSSLGVIVAAISVAAFHWLWADGVVSLFVAVLITSSSIPLIWESVQSLRQRPAAIAPEVSDEAA
jgi:cobalt-zinc-cadmium efflux system protein